eukprot:jgi/Ulvmu1/12750/UM095_0055.1
MCELTLTDAVHPRFSRSPRLRAQDCCHHRRQHRPQIGLQWSWVASCRATVNWNPPYLPAYLSSAADMSGYQDRPGSQPRIGDVVQAIITRIKPQFGLFVELPLPRREYEGLIHLSEISRSVHQLVRQVRGRTESQEIIQQELERSFSPGDHVMVRILKYKVDRGKTVADASLLDIDQRTGRSSIGRAYTPERDFRRDAPLDRYDDRRHGRDVDSRSVLPRRIERDSGRIGRDPVDDSRARRQTNVARGRNVQLPELHSIHQATIINAFHDGIFVKVPGYEVDGLVHHSQISRQLNMDNTIPKVERYKQITGMIGEVNTQVWVKVVYVAKTEHLKCECSLKMVSQKNGRDLDPDHALWLEYMRLRRSKGAGYMHPEMKAEMERVEMEMQRLEPNGVGTHAPSIDIGAAPYHERDTGDRKRPLDTLQDRSPGRSYTRMEAVSPDRKVSRYGDDDHDRQTSRYADRPDPSWQSQDTMRRAGNGRDVSDANRDTRGYSEHDNRAPTDRQYGMDRRTYAEGNQNRRPEEYGMPADTQGRAHGDWRLREDPSPVFSSRVDSHTAGAPPDAQPDADLLANPVLKEKFETMVAATVRAQLEQALKASGGVNLGGGHATMNEARSDQQYDMRDRHRD